MSVWFRKVHFCILRKSPSRKSTNFCNRLLPILNFFLQQFVNIAPLTIFRRFSFYKAVNWLLSLLIWFAPSLKRRRICVKALQTYILRSIEIELKIVIHIFYYDFDNPKLLQSFFCVSPHLFIRKFAKLLASITQAKAIFSCTLLAEYFLINYIGLRKNI